MKPPVDLHTHSTYSDGICTVDEVCALAVKTGLRYLALSDHDTTAGLAPISERLNGINRETHTITWIPAIEVSSGDNGLTHILGYGIQPGAQPLERELEALRRIRTERNRETLELLDVMLGTGLSREPVPQPGEENPVVGRMHVARLLIRHGVVRSVDEAFSRYLGEGKPAYLPLQHMSTRDAIELLLKSGAVPVLAHPVRIGLFKGDAEASVAKLMEYGLKGLEVFHPSASHQDVKTLYRLARDHSLLVTGGSDFHGEWGIRSKVGMYPPGWLTWQQDIDALQSSMAVSAAF